ncbi:MAG TPA: hypothetical protein VK158_05375 [Acidobacteriota bacterium]|nr:hypothetical protein [Acidobacteriota bacterium]
MVKEEKSLLPAHFPLVIRYRGNVDYIAIFHEVFAWMGEQYMTVYQKAVKDKASGPGTTDKEFEIVGVVRADEFVKWTTTVKAKFLDAREVMHQGRKIYNGRIELIVEGTLILDPDNAFEGDGALLNMGKIFMNFFKRDKELLPDKVYVGRLEQLFARLKKHLGDGAI